MHVNARAAVASVGVSIVIAATTLAGCGANHGQGYSCSGDGLKDLNALGTTLTEAFPEAGTPNVVDDCDSSGKASVSASQSGSVDSLAGALPSEWACVPRGASTDDMERYFRCTIKSQPTQVILEYNDDETAKIYLTPRAPAE